MTVIEAMKEELDQRKPNMSEWDQSVALLVEYYEASEAESKYVGASGDTETYRRLQKARAELEREE